MSIFNYIVMLPTFSLKLQKNVTMYTFCRKAPLIVHGWLIMHNSLANRIAAFAYVIMGANSAKQ